MVEGEFVAFSIREPHTGRRLATAGYEFFNQVRWLLDLKEFANATASPGLCKLATVIKANLPARKIALSVRGSPDFLISSEVMQ